MSGAPVEDLTVSVFTVPTEGPESDGTLTWTATTVVVAEPTAGGVTGLGFTYASPAAATVIHNPLRHAVIGVDAMDVPAAWRGMIDAVRNIGRPGIASSAISAVEISLWDLKAKLLDLALADLLGRCHDDTPAYGSGGFTSYTDAELTDQLAGWVHGDGIGRVKMKIGTRWGRHPDRDVERVIAARAAIGETAELYVDANGAYTRKQAARLACSFADAGATWFEEPVSSDDLAGLQELRGLTAMDIAAGEYGYDLVYFERMCAAGAVDVLQADITRCGGVTEWLRAAAVAAAHGLDISGHCAQSLHAHVACAVPNVRHLEYFHDHARLDRLLFDGVLEPVEGRLRPDPGRPGLGLDLKRSDAERFRVR